MSVAMIYRGDSPHPAHQGFAEAINADLLNLDQYSLKYNYLHHSISEEIINGLLLPEYDIYIAEGTRALYGSLANQIVSSSTLIYLSADQSIFEITDSSYEVGSLVNRAISNFGMVPLKLLFNTYIDGSIAVSEFAANYTSKVLNTPIKIVHPYIQSNIYYELENVSPVLNSNTVITVGTFSHYKGQDILVDAWEEVRKQFPKATLKLVGSDYPPELSQKPGITVCGYVEDLCSELKYSSLYVQPSRADSYPVSVLEALRAGLPTLVTTTTGNKVEAQQVSEDLVVEPTSTSIATGIINYFNKPLSYRRRMSNMAKHRGGMYSSTTQKEIFQRKFHELLSEIER